MHYSDGENRCSALILKTRVEYSRSVYRSAKGKSIIANRFARYLLLERKKHDSNFFFYFFFYPARAFLIKTADFPCNTMEAIEILRHNFNGEKLDSHDRYKICNIKVINFALQIQKTIYIS